MSWADSLIKLSTYEVEVLQKRLAEVTDRRITAELRLVGLLAEGEAEARRAKEDAASGWYHIGFLDGLRMRKTAAQNAIDAALAEERGARDALALAFETQKKYEQIAETARQAQRKEMAKRETASLDELGLRKASAR